MSKGTKKNVPLEFSDIDPFADLYQIRNFVGVLIVKKFEIGLFFSRLPMVIIEQNFWVSE